MVSESTEEITMGNWTVKWWQVPLLYLGKLWMMYHDWKDRKTNGN